MAARRMIDIATIDSDQFCNLPSDAQLLYFHMSIRADDDGFVNRPQGILRQTGLSTADLDTLVAAGYLIAFSSGTYVIKHWRVHNRIPRDRYKPSRHQERALLAIDESGAYILVSDLPDDWCAHNVYTLLTQDRAGKDSTGKGSAGKGITHDTGAIVPGSECETDIQQCLIDQGYDLSASNVQLLHQALIAYSAFRDSISRPITPQICHLLLKELLSLSPNVDEQTSIINQSLRYGWTGLFPLKKDAPTNKNGSTLDSLYSNLAQFTSKHAITKDPQSRIVSTNGG